MMFSDFLLALVLISCTYLILQIAAEDDTDCLMQFKRSVGDPNKNLSNWDFTNGRSICSFNGVQCWNDQENKVVSLELSQAGLTGGFPRGLSECKSLIGLDLSGNSFMGPIPADICSQLPYLTTLNLSSNQITGEIPANLGSCTYLNELDLQNNDLSGSIPWQIGTLTRLTKLHLSSNSLSGEIPSDLSTKSAASFSGNKDLCGEPLDKCKSKVSSNIPVIITCAALMFILVYICWVLLARRQHRSFLVDTQMIRVQMLEDAQYLKLSQKELHDATGNFGEANVIGKGGSSIVYRANLSNGRVIAVKRLECFDYHKMNPQTSSNPRSGNKEMDPESCRDITGSTAISKQFLTELHVLGKLRHRNLLRILGYCYNHLDFMAIIMDYMPMGSLDDVLHSPTTPHKQIGWRARLKIITDIAEGLNYLHSEYDGKRRVVHGDLKPANVLLDDKQVPHIADFGLATMVAATTHSNFKSASKLQHASSIRPWSFGYTAPECALQGAASVKADIFSFGVVILEVITGERPSSDKLSEGQTLAGWVAEALLNLNRTSAATSYIGPILAEGLHGDEMKEWGQQIVQVLRMGCSCACGEAARRPSIHEVLHVLRDLNDPILSIHSNSKSDRLCTRNSNGLFLYAPQHEEEEEMWILSNEA